MTEVWEQPGVMGLRVEAVVPWSDDTQRYDLVRYVKAKLKLDPFDDGVFDDTVRFADRSALPRSSSEPSEWVAQMHKAEPHGAPKAVELDVLRSQHHFTGMIVSERAAAIVTDNDDVDLLPVTVGSKKIDFVFIPLPLRSDFDWERSRFAITEGLTSSVIIDRPDPGTVTNIETFHDLGDDLSDQPGFRYCAPNVVVLSEAPPIMFLLRLGFPGRRSNAIRGLVSSAVSGVR